MGSQALPPVKRVSFGAHPIPATRMALMWNHPNFAVLSSSLTRFDIAARLITEEGEIFLVGARPGDGLVAADQIVCLLNLWRMEICTTVQPLYFG